MERESKCQGEVKQRDRKIKQEKRLEEKTKEERGSKIRKRLKGKWKSTHTHSI